MRFMTDKKFGKAKYLADRYSVNQSTIWRWVATGKIPQPFRPTKRTSLFDIAAVDAVLSGESND